MSHSQKESRPPISGRYLDDGGHSGGCQGWRHHCGGSCGAFIAMVPALRYAARCPRSTVVYLRTQPGTSLNSTPTPTPLAWQPPMSPRHRLTSVNHDKSTPFIIGVAGGTGSGKTTVCRELESRSNSGSKGCRVIILSQVPQKTDPQPNPNPQLPVPALPWYPPPPKIHPPPPSPESIGRIIERSVHPSHTQSLIPTLTLSISETLPSVAHMLRYNPPGPQSSRCSCVTCNMRQPAPSCPCVVLRVFTHRFSPSALCFRDPPPGPRPP